MIHILGIQGKKKRGCRTDRTETEFEDDRNQGRSSYFTPAYINPDKAEGSEDNLVINNFEYFSFMRGYDFVTKRRTRPLKLRKKLYEFYAAPISKYFSHSVIKLAIFSSLQATWTLWTLQVHEWLTC